MVSNGISIKDGKRTFNKVGDKTHLIASKHVAFAGNTDCSQDVVTSAHHVANTCFVQLGDHTGSTWFQFVFKDDETQEFQVGLSLLSSHFLDFRPAQFPFILGGASNHTVSLMSIIAQKILVVRGNCKIDVSDVGLEGAVTLT